jgi:hypothetical protein
MTTIFKANRAFTGPKSLGSLSAVTKTPSDLYTEYSTRVTADGGVIQDAAATLAAITSAINTDYFYRSSVALSPSWGTKRSGSNIAKFYNLVGTADAVVTGTIALDTTTEAFALADMSAAGCSLKVTGASLLAGEAMFMTHTSWYSSSDIRYSVLNGAQEWLLYEAPMELYVGGVKIAAASPEFAAVSKNAIGALISQNGDGKISLVVDGLIKKIVTSSFAPITTGATGDISLVRTGANTRMAELWYMNNASVISAMALADSMNSRY